MSNVSSHLDLVDAVVEAEEFNRSLTGASTLRQFGQRVVDLYEEVGADLAIPASSGARSIVTAALMLSDGSVRTGNAEEAVRRALIVESNLDAHWPRVLAPAAQRGQSRTRC
jgi:hypothetical protein